MSSGSGYAGRHRDPLPPVAVAASTGQNHYLVWLIAGAVAAVMLLFSVVVYPSLAGNQTPQTGAGRSAASSSSDPGRQLFGAPEASGTGYEWPTGTSTSGAETATTSTSDPTAPTATTEPGTGSADLSTSAERAATSTAAQGSTSSAAGTTPPASGSTPSASATESNPRVVARALFPEYGFPDGQFGCLNTMWTRLGLWGTSAQVRPGLIYVKGRYGTPCAAWDEVQRTGNY